MTSNKTWIGQTFINDKRFGLLGTSKTKKEAEKRADFARSRGWLVRVLHKTGVINGFNWAIYTRRK